MFFGKKPKFLSSFVWKLCFWHTVVFAIVIGLATTIIYLFMAKTLLHEVDQFLATEVVEFENILPKEGIKGVVDGIVDEASELGIGRVYFRLYSLSQADVHTSDLSNWGKLPETDLSSISHVKSSYKTIYIQSNDNNQNSAQKYQVRIGYFPISSDLILEVGQSLEDKDERLDSYFYVLIALAISATLLSMLVGYMMVRRAMRRVDQITTLALSVTESNFSNRVPLSGGNDEIERLAMTLNAMLDRIGRLVVGLKQVVDDLSHELRTIFSRMRIEAEIQLRSKTSEEQWREFGLTVIEETDRLIGTINSILDISETEARLTKLNLLPLDIVQLIKDTCSLFETIATEKQVSIAISGIESCEITGDRKRLERVFSNLLDNAIKYNTVAGKVDIIIAESSKSVEINVSDTGIGIVESDLPYVFDRFFRAQGSVVYPGSGLGLSLVKAIVEAHGGTISVKSNPSLGSTFSITLLKKFNS